MGNTPRSWLTEKDREFLRNRIENGLPESGEESAADKQRRYRVRKRARQALKDFRLLVDGGLTVQEFKYIFDTDSALDEEELNKGIEGLLFLLAFGSPASDFRRQTINSVSHAVFMQNLIYRNQLVEPKITFEISSEKDRELTDEEVEKAIEQYDQEPKGRTEGR